MDYNNSMNDSFKKTLGFIFGFLFLIFICLGVICYGCWRQGQLNKVAAQLEKQLN